MEPTPKQIDDCRRKRAYESKEAATAADSNEPYRCIVCGKWHTHTGIRGRISKAKKELRQVEYHGGIKPSRLTRRRKWK